MAKCATKNTRGDRASQSDYCEGWPGAEAPAAGCGRGAAGGLWSNSTEPVGRPDAKSECGANAGWVGTGKSVGW